VPDEQVREDAPVLARDEALQVTLDLDGVFLAREAEALREPPDVRVDDDALSVAELGRDDVRRLARHSREPGQLGERPRDLAVELLDQHLHRAADGLRLLSKEAGGTDVVLELLDRDREVVLGAPVLAEERLRDAVHVHVGRLRGEHHGHEELEVGAEAKRDRRVGMLRCEPLDDRDDPLALRPDAPPRLGDETTRHEGSVPRRRG